MLVSKMPLPIEHYIDASEDNAWIRDFLSTWKLDHATGGGDIALEIRLQRLIEESADAALALLVSLSEQSIDGAERVAIGEELEWFLQKHGAMYWNTLNELCSRVPQFRAVMATVWGASLPKDLKRKVEMWRS